MRWRDVFMRWRNAIPVLKGVAGEIGYRLRPARRAFGAGAKATVSAVFIPLELLIKLFSLMADVGDRIVAGAAAIGVAIDRGFGWLTRVVRPEPVVALVIAAAAIALAASQFFDYRGVTVGEPQYSGEVGAVAPPPDADLRTAGSAHAYLLVPVAIAALVLTVLTVRGRWQLGRWIALLGVAGIAVSLAVDAPKGLDAGVPGIAYYGTDAQLLEGFWAQLASSAALVGLGLLLSAYARGARVTGGAEPRSRSRYSSPPEPRPSAPGTPGEAGA